MTSAPPLRYALVGAGHRSEMYVRAAAATHASSAQLVAISDVNAVRCRLAAELATSLCGEPVATFDPSELESIVDRERIDRVIVTTPDATHAEYVVRALRAGADVVVEKPLTTDADGCRAIAAAIAETGRDVIVTFNYRYSPRNSALKRLIMADEIGDVTSITFEWLLDTAHGADYFRRWHRVKANSGGLLVHKSSHHFDLTNWWIADSPRRVFASGGLRFYGADNARRHGFGERPERGTHDGPHDPFELDLRADERLARLYLEAEHLDGYRRDLDVFGPGISIEDNLAVIVDYDGGATLSYSLNAHAPWEGYRVGVNGTRGRAELEVVERAAVLVGEDGSLVLDPSATEDSAAGDALRRRGERLTVQRHWQEPREIAISQGAGAHGGGDAILLSDIFEGAGEDPLGRPSDYRDGLRAVAVGIAANRSLETGAPVGIAELGLGADLRRRALP